MMTIKLTKRYSLATKQAAMYQSKLLNLINISSLPPQELKLKIKAPIILIRNLYHKKGYCNGTLYSITDLNYNLIALRI